MFCGKWCLGGGHVDTNLTQFRVILKLRKKGKQNETHLHVGKMKKKISNFTSWILSNFKLIIWKVLFEIYLCYHHSNSNTF